MSGIAGLWVFDQLDLGSAPLERMMQAMASRGTDLVGLWHEAAVAFGNQLLWVTPESQAEQLPLITDNLVLVADARIDNRAELLSTLGFATASADLPDSTLILAAYQKWGVACPEKLLGDFAFAIWDKAERRLFCARDPMGVKQLYYYASNQMFAFATEIAALLCLPEIPSDLNELALANYLAPALGLAQESGATFYQSIFSLPAGNSLTVQSRELRTNVYWSLDPTIELHYPSDDDYTEAFRELVRDAVTCRLRSAYPIAAALSGGLDSSSVVCIARDLLGGSQTLHTYYMLSEAPACDERPYVKTVLARGGLEHHEIPNPSPLLGMVDLLRDKDLPSFIHNHPLMLQQYQAAQRQGVRVFLDGIDGDTVIGYGRGYLTELSAQRDWATLSAEIVAYAKNQNRPSQLDFSKYAAPVLAGFVRSGEWGQFREGLARISSGLGLSQAELMGSMAKAALVGRLGSLRPKSSASDSSVIHPDFARRIAQAQRVQKRASRSESIPVSRQEHYRILTTGILQSQFADSDQIAARCSLEARHPLSDQRIAKFCLALPGRQKFGQGHMRFILRRAMKDILPEKIRWRSSKTDFGPHIIQSLQTTDRPLLDDLFLGDSSASVPYIDAASLREIYQRFTQHPTNPDVQVLLRSAKLILWLKAHGS